MYSETKIKDQNFTNST